MAKTKTTAPPPLPKSHYKGEYDWAPDELLDECSLLNSVEDVEAHRGALLSITSMRSTKITTPKSW